MTEWGEGPWEVLACPGCWSWQIDVSYADLPSPAEREVLMQEALSQHALDCPPLAFIDQGARLDRSQMETWLDG